MTRSYADTIRDEVVELFEDGSVRLDQRCFEYLGGRRMTSRRFHDLFGGPPRVQGSPPGRREADLAASVQLVLEDVVLGMARAAYDANSTSALCVGGGVALNCVANGRLGREGPFERLWVQPAAGDAGSAVGAALWAWHGLLDQPRVADPSDGMHGAFLGPGFGHDEVHRWLDREAVAHEVIADDEKRCELVAERLASGAVVGWFAGRLEFGPRALGHRSILADARSPSVQAHINGLVKERAAFRPFAPAVLAERAESWFDMEGSAPYMNLAVQVAAGRAIDPGPMSADLTLGEIVALVRSEIPAVTHVDGSARVQTVDDERNPEFAMLLRAFEARSGCPVLLNTSFNTRDEPIVCTPSDALATHRRAGLDLLVVEDCLIEAGA